MTAPRTTKKLYIRTFGCQMNVYDSGRMADVLAPLGYGLTDAPDDADMVIVNTCHIREKASEKLFSDLGRLRTLKRDKAASGGMILAVAGCVAQAEGAEIVARAPYVDIVLGPQTYHRLPEMVARAARAVAGDASGRAGAGVLDTDFPVEPKFDFLPAETTIPETSAFLTIQEGCDKFCSYCVVPYTRGAEYSRDATAILAEARRLIAGGAREITLLGQNVNAFHGQGPDGRVWGLGRLIRALAELPDLWRIRYTTSHPRDMDDDLIAAHGEVPALMPFLHLPVQAGSDRVLAAMNRGHSADDYRRLVDRLRAARPDLALSSDFIVGHPGETEADFQQTMRLVADIGFSQCYSFKFSPRPGTPSALADEQVPEAVMSRRLAELQALLEAQQRAHLEAQIGLTHKVLLDRPGRHPGQLVGKNPWLQAVHVMAPSRALGNMLDVTITACTGHSLAGVPTIAFGMDDGIAAPASPPIPAILSAEACHG